MTARRGAARGADDPRAPAPWLFDVLLGTGVALTLALVIASDVGQVQPDYRSYLWAVGFGALMLVRRRYPAAVVALSVVGFFAYYATGNSPIGVALPVAAAVFSAAEAGRQAVAVGGSLVTVGLSVGYRLAVGQEPAFVVGYELPQNLLILAAAIALGDSTRSRRRLQRQAAEIEALTAERTRREAAQRIAAERLAMSRDLHDSIGHSLSVVSLHAEVAKEAGTREEERRRALEVISGTTAEAMAELRRTVAGLRSGEVPPRHTVGLESLESAVAPARAAGIAIVVDADVDTPVPATVGSTVYRIVQESTTNIVRHSTATTARVDVRIRDGAVRVEVSDNGGTADVGRDRDRGFGHGLLGMRERVEGLGGTLHAGPTDSGFHVEAVLPLVVP